jgi:hypothetical protein
MLVGWAKLSQKINGLKANERETTTHPNKFECCEILLEQLKRQRIFPVVG